VVYHLFSIAKKHGPITLRMRTRDRDAGVHLPSLTPVWRSAELQEREIFDLFGVVFDGHPDLRRLLMWPVSRTIRCAGTTSIRTITNMSRPRTTKCCDARSSIGAKRMESIQAKRGRDEHSHLSTAHFDPEPTDEPSKEQLLELSMGPQIPPRTASFA